ncbi:MAG: thiol-disulfide isomerase [Acidobacteria bacterium]|nr:thiol-disulfide isomerase [Acidobacteriota bacterium]
MRTKRISSFFVAIALSLVAGFTFLATTQADNTKGAEKTVTFNKDIAPIFYKNCTECHRPGESAPFSTLSYKDVRPWAKSIKEKVADRTMPPWHADPHFGEFSNNRVLTQAEIDTIVAWVNGGAKEGDVKDLPPAPKFTEGWNIAKPDAIIQLPEEYAYKPGVDEYQYFDVPTNFTEDKYVTMAEARPGNRKIVHHIIAFIIPPGSPTMAGQNPEQRAKMMEMQLKNSPFYRDGFLMRMKPEQPVIDDACADPRSRSGGDSLLVGYAPGRQADYFPPGVVRRIPAGATIRFQMHYSSQTAAPDAVEKDRSEIGLVFAKEITPATKLITTNSIGNIMFKIPAGAEHHRVTACKQVKRDTTIYGLMPHMHLRGKSMEYKVFYPDGKSEVLLNVPNYDFSWQTDYILKQPKHIPAGSRLMVTAYFDNSAKNKFNPDPTKDVRYGEPTYDEMMLGFMDFVTEMPPVAKLDPKILDSYAGKYEVMPGILASVTRDGNKLIVAIPMRAKLEFVPTSETQFFLTGSDTDLTIVKNDKGEVVEAVIGNMHAKKVKDGTAGGSGN